MKKSKLHTHSYCVDRQSGNAVVVILVILAIVALGGLAFMSGKVAQKGDSVEQVAAESAEQSGAAQTTAAVDAKAPEIQPGNPVVATVDGTEIKRLDVLQFIQTLPSQTQQLPIKQLFPLARDQVISAKVIETKTKSVNLNNDPKVKEQLAAAKKEIVKAVYIQNEIDKAITDDMIAKQYEEIKKNTPNAEEIRASHILVEDKKTANEVLEKLIETGDFAGLAKEYSKDSTAENGGELGYFLKTDVVKEFGDVAFGMEPGIYTKDPVKTEFGYHIIRVEDKRKRQPPTLEQAKPFIEANLRQKALGDIVSKWTADANVKRLDINGEDIKAKADDVETEADSSDEEKSAE